MWGKRKSRKRSPSAEEDNWADILTRTVRKALAGSGSKREQETIDPRELEERAQSLEALADMLRTRPEQLGFKVAPLSLEDVDVEAQWGARDGDDGDATPGKGEAGREELRLRRCTVRIRFNGSRGGQICSRTTGYFRPCMFD